jgi:Fe-S-cluster containining protein
MDLTRPDPSDSIAFRLNLVQGESRAVVSVALPTGAIPADDLLPVLYQFDDAAVGLAEAESQRQGKHVSCRVGCAACCRQFIPVSQHEARRIARLVANLPDDRRREIEERFEHATGQLEQHGLLERAVAADQLESEAQRAELGHAYFELGLACPFLEDERCTIYCDRPMACREYLVTSPPEHCWSPRTKPVEAVPVAANISAALYRFGDDGSPGPARWIPLIWSLKWTSDQRPGDAPKLPAPEVFRRFMRIVER